MSRFKFYEDYYILPPDILKILAQQQLIVVKSFS